MNERTTEWKEYNSISEVLDDISEGNYSWESGSSAEPDVYGRALQFYNILNDVYNKRDNKIQGVYLWRGLITLIALKEYLELPVTWEKVTLSDNNSSIFRNALFYPPQVSMFNNKEGWDGKVFWVLKWDVGTGQDICLYSPITLIYPVADIYQVFENIPEIKWFDYSKKDFLNPVSVLTVTEKAIVRYWLEQTKNALSGAGSVYDTVSHHLTQFAEELSDGKNLPDCFKYSVMDSESSISNHDGVNWLNRSINVRLQDASENINAEEFFSQRLCYFVDQRNNPFGACEYSEAYKIGDMQGGYAFLPVNGKMREICASYDIPEHITMSVINRQGRDYIRVLAKLSEVNSGWIDLTKEYRICSNEVTKTGENIAFQYGEVYPAIAVWPGKLCDVWKKYYIFLHELSSEGQIEIDPQEGHRKDNRYVIEVEHIPYVIPLIYTDNRKEKYSIGIVTPKREENLKKNRATIQVEVGIDFGTSSTRAFMKKQGEDYKQEIDISEDTSLLVMGCSEQERQLMRNYFISESRIKSQLFSIYRKTGEHFLENIEPIHSGVIFQSMNEEILEHDKYFISDIKWNDTNCRGYYGAFIMQLCLQTTIILYYKYGVSSITWRYALPQSLDETIKGFISKTWVENVREYLQNHSQGITHEFEEYVTESEAASRYFLFDRENRRVNANKGFFVIDIGGGSTDIALWQEKEKIQMKYHTSVQVAGREMLAKWILKYIGPLTENASNNPALHDMKEFVLEEPDESMKITVTERILNYYYTALYQGFYDAYQEGIRKEWAIQLRSKVTQAVAIMMFGLGYQMGRMIQDKKMIIPEGAGSVVLAFGGKGSHVLEWCEHGNDHSNVIQFFKKGMNAAGEKSEYAVEVQISGNLKTEVAKGLLEMSTNIKTDNFREIEIAESGKENCCFETDQIEDVLGQLEKAYDEIIIQKYPYLEKMTFNRNHIANLLTNFSGESCDTLIFFMDVLYKQYISKKGEDICSL